MKNHRTRKQRTSHGAVRVAMRSSFAMRVKEDETRANLRGITSIRVLLPAGNHTTLNRAGAQQTAIKPSDQIAPTHPLNRNQMQSENLMRCVNKLCRCQVETEDQFCSQACRQAQTSPQGNCQCGHPECVAARQAAGADGGEGTAV
jgi:hypothetical protein